MVGLDAMTMTLNSFISPYNNYNYNAIQKICSSDKIITSSMPCVSFSIIWERADCYKRPKREYFYNVAVEKLTIKRNDVFVERLFPHILYWDYVFKIV